MGMNTQSNTHLFRRFDCGSYFMGQGATIGVAEYNTDCPGFSSSL